MIRSRGEKVFNIANIVFMLALGFVMIYPVAYVFGRSFMTDVERSTRPFGIIAKDWNIEGYKFIFSNQSNVPGSYAVTIARTLIGTVFNLLFTAFAAYVLSKRYYPLRKPVTILIVFTMWFSGGLIPNFLLIRSLGLMNNFMVYILPGLINPWNMLLLRNFFEQIPDSIEESARIDGAGDWIILFRIVLPLSGAALATIGLFYAVWHWNSWFDAMLYTSDRSMWTVQLLLREMVNDSNMANLLSASATVEVQPQSETVKLSTIVASTIPILCVYPFLQKYFVKGVTVGSVKE